MRRARAIFRTPLLNRKAAGDGKIDRVALIRATRSSVKQFTTLLQVMIAYFGWAYVGILSILTVSGSIAIGYGLAVLMRNNLKRR